jgi:hypothetical protein
MGRWDSLDIRGRDGGVENGNAKDTERLIPAGFFLKALEKQGGGGTFSLPERIG